jgi:hypothetical protein
MNTWSRLTAAATCVALEVGQTIVQSQCREQRRLLQLGWSNPHIRDAIATNQLGLRRGFEHLAEMPAANDFPQPDAA